MTLVPKTRSSGAREAASLFSARTADRALGRSPADPRSATWQQSAATCEFLRSAFEPMGNGPYAEALREWIERVTPRDVVVARQPPQLRLIR